MIIVSPIALKNYSTLEYFLCDLRRYKKDSLVKIGLKEIWSTLSYSNQPICEINSRLILLSLAAANNFRDKVATSFIFEELRNNYVSIDDPEIDLDSLISRIKSLENLKEHEKIPEKYLIQDNLQVAAEAYSCFKTENLIKRQNYNISNVMQTSWKLFSDYNRQQNNQPLKILRKILQIDPLHFLRSSYAFLHFAKQNNGYIFIDQTIFDKNDSEKFGINSATLQLVATKLSMDQDNLYEGWLKKEIQEKIPKMEQKYFPNPLARTPLVHMNKKGNENKEFLIPSPFYLFSAISNYLFLTLSENDKDFKAKFGDIIENHIGNCLKSIFGNRVKINSTKKGNAIADFEIELNECILIIEVKTTIAPYDDCSILGVRNIAKIWNDLYTTCQQLSSSILQKHEERSGKIIIPITIFYNTFHMEILPFRIFAEKSGIFRDLGLNLVEFFSWAEFESLLSKTSESKFEKQLIERQQKVSEMNVEEIHNFSVERDTPTHSYDYLPEILPKKV